MALSLDVARCGRLAGARNERMLPDQ